MEEDRCAAWIISRHATPRHATKVTWWRPRSRDPPPRPLLSGWPLNTILPDLYLFFLFYSFSPLLLLLLSSIINVQILYLSEREEAFVLGPISFIHSFICFMMFQWCFNDEKLTSLPLLQPSIWHQSLQNLKLYPSGIPQMLYQSIKIPLQSRVSWNFLEKSFINP